VGKTQGKTHAGEGQRSFVSAWRYSRESKMLELESRDDGVILRVKARAGARQNAIRGIEAGALKVHVTQIAEKGKANKAIIDLLSKSLQIPKSQIELFTGNTSPQKKFLVRGINQQEFVSRICRVV
jgi:hypothetical protein